jgi:hypothetical protein
MRVSIARTTVLHTRPRVSYSTAGEERVPA